MIFKRFNEKFKEIIQFLREPSIQEIKNLSVKHKLKDVLVLYLLKFFIVIIIMLLIKQIIGFKHTGIDDLKYKFSGITLFLFGVFLGPLIEETIFRLSLVFKPIYITISGSLFYYIVISKYYFNTSYLNFESNILVRIITMILLASVIYIYASKHSEKLKIFWNNNFKWLYYISIVVFGFLHIGNFDMTNKNLMLTPLFVLPQFLGGVFNGYVRIKYGFIYAIIIHSLHNLLPMLINIL